MDAFSDERFTTVAVFVLLFWKEAFVDCWNSEVMWSIHALTLERFRTDAVLIETLLNDALVVSCNKFVTYKFVTEAVVTERSSKEAFADTCSVLVTFVTKAVEAEKLTVEAVFIDA